MKGNRAPWLLKRIIEVLSTKTNELRTRVTIFMLLNRDKSLLTDGMQSMLGGQHHRLRCDKNEDDGDVFQGKSFIIYMNRESATVMEPTPPETTPHPVFAHTQENLEGNHREYLTSTLFKESEEEMELTDDEDNLNDQMMVILEDNNVRLNHEAGEDDVDQAADLFIHRFRRQMRMQKQ